MNKIKFLVFADLHHYPGVFFTNGRERFAEIKRRAEDEGVEFIVSLGDFCHSPTTFTDIIADSAASKLPIYHVMGNHDTDGATVADVLKCYKMPHEYYFFDRNGFRFIMLDTNYYRCSTGCTHFQYRNYFDFPRTRETMPEEEIDWLEQTIHDSPGLCLLCSHASIERESGGGVANQNRIWDIIKRENAGKRKVLMALNGHYHRDSLRIRNNIACFDVNSASFDWCNQPHQYFPEELSLEYEMIDHQIVYTEPLSAVVTISDDGKIEIDGKYGSFFRGITREMTNNSRCDNAGRPCTPHITSACLQLFSTAG